MNLLKLGKSAWILVLILVFSIILLMLLIYDFREHFVNYPQQIDPTAKISSNSAATNANTNYASVLLFIQNNPEKSAKFISDIKQKFFNNTCTVKDNIDFMNIAKLPDGMPFS